MSPRKDHWSNGGAVGTEVTPLMISYLLTAHRYQDSETARSALGISREALMTMIRYIEQKTKRRLFITNGCYYGLDDVDPWDIERDARTYAGPYPVVAHPPCQLWVNLAAVNFKRYGGEHNRPGNDQGCFAAALAAVRKYGGVLEHPAYSNAWKTFGLLQPRGIGWRTENAVSWVCEVWQSAYGHKARKRTWLYYVGRKPADLNWSREPGTHQCGWFDRIKPTLSKREAMATPPAFRDALLELVRPIAQQAAA